jgi:hypothetical protein
MFSKVVENDYRLSRLRICAALSRGRAVFNSSARSVGFLKFQLVISCLYVVKDTL